MNDPVAGAPRTLVVGIGASSGAERTEVLRLLTDTLREAGLARSAVARLATVTGKADHPAVRWAADRLAGASVPLPVDEHPPEALAGVPVPNPSATVGTAVGTASVAEAAALASAPGGRLVVTKRKSARATVAIARMATDERPTPPAAAPATAPRTDPDGRHHPPRDRHRGQFRDRHQRHPHRPAPAERPQGDPA
ncbi:cobalamin biosynthesis protein [Kitasatospora sp. NPDC005856]|uniref:cobalamin biosynthesis protein n=1 Tax=Kitasatospora sp. NPDC005856 TaxID=3154566 RepID=UPI0033E24AD9